MPIAPRVLARPVAALVTAALSLTSIGRAQAPAPQNPPAAPAPAPAPVEPESEAAATAAAVAANSPGSNLGFAPGIDPNSPVERIKFSDMAIGDVLTLLESLTGKTVIRPAALPTQPLTLHANPPLTRAEALVLLETLLSLNGIGLAPLGPRAIKVVPAAQIHSEAPELVAGSLRDAPPSGRIVSKIFRLRYLDTQTFDTQMRQFLSPSASVVQFPTSNSVVVTDTVSNLQRLEYLVTEVDRRLNIETKFYQINYANAADLADQIRNLLESARSGLNAGRTGGGGAPNAAEPNAATPAQPPAGAPAGAAGAVPLQVVLSSNIAINADERTNQLIVISDPANLSFFDNLIEKLDVPAEAPTRIDVIPLKYADAEELASLISQLISGRSQSARAGDRSDRQRRPSNAYPDINRRINEAAEAARQRQQTVQTAIENAQQAEGSQFSDLMTVLADTRSNAIIASGTNNDLALIHRVIDELDVVLPQVRIEVVIAEVTLSKNYQRGIDAFGIKYDEATGAFTISNSDSTIPVSGTVSGVLEGHVFSNLSIDAVIKAARGNSDIDLLSVPAVVTTHNKEAHFLVGQSRPIVAGTNQSIENPNARFSSFTYQDIATELTVTPKIGPNDVIQLEILQTFNDVGTTPVTIDGNEQPVIIKREAESYVSVKDGQLIVLGGLQSSQERRNVSRMFLLGEIPLIGELFTKHTSSREKSEILMFIRPTLIRTTEHGDSDARQNVHRLPAGERSRQMLEDITGEDLTPPEEPPAPPPAHPPRGGRRR